MPTYCFTRADNRQTVEIQMTAAELAKRQSKEGWIKLEDGTLAFRNLRAEHVNTSHAAGNWPMKSDAAGVAASQVKDAIEHSKKIGIPTDFTPDGRAIFTSAKHRKRYCEAVGLYDRNGGYSDPQRK